MCEIRLLASTDFDYGFGARGGVLPPYAGMTFGKASSHTMRTGARWALEPDLALALEATRSGGAEARKAK